MKLVACEMWDNLDHWKLTEEEKAQVKALGWVVMCDTESVTHLCEITPSRWYVYLYPIVLLKDGIENDDLRDRLEQEQRVSTEGYGDYSHTEFWRKGNVHWADHSKDDPDETPEEVFEGWREYWNGNCPI